ncbi:MAG: hypothetical protein AAF228_06070 [Pseudomonadota bacterium]
MPRPRKDDAEKKSVTWDPVRVTPLQDKIAKAKAKAAGLSFPEFTRQNNTTGRITPNHTPIEASLVTELNRLWIERRNLGNNFNQIARQLNRGREDHVCLENLNGLIEQMRLSDQKLASVLQRIDKAYGGE